MSSGEINRSGQGRPLAVEGRGEDDKIFWVEGEIEIGLSVGVTKCKRRIEFGDPQVFVVVDVDVDGAIEECVTFGGGGRDIGIVCAAMHGAIVWHDIGGKDQSPPRAAIRAA